jgi:hypothetical protein
LWIGLGILAGLVALVFASPWLIWQYLNAKARRSSADKRQLAFDKYRASMYYLNQLGYSRSNLGPQQYAVNIDEQFGTKLQSFSNVYQKLKYSSAALTAREQTITDDFYSPFIHSVRKQVPFKTRFSRFLNIYNTIHYFSQPKLS